MYRYRIIYLYVYINLKTHTYIYIYIYIYSRSSVTQHADNSTLPITQDPKNNWLDSYLLHIKNPITQQI